MYVRTFTELLLLSFFSSNLPSPSSSRIRIALSAPSLFPLCLNFFSFKSIDKSSCFPGRVRQNPSTVDFPTTGTTPFGSEFDPIYRGRVSQLCQLYEVLFPREKVKVHTVDERGRSILFTECHSYITNKEN